MGISYLLFMTKEFFHLMRQQLDRKLKPLHLLRKLEAPAGGWIRAIRTSLGLTGVAYARRLGVTSASVADMERSEASGTITLNSLRKAAAAMDCDLVYAIVPRATLEDILKQHASEKARTLLGRVGHSMLLEAQAVEPSQARQQVEALVNNLLENPKALWK
jgi:predicted DNA-binding mobile mystery protein A